MARSIVFLLALLSFSLPALGKGRNDIYPVPCNDLWNAVKETLGNTGNYNLVTSDDSAMAASYMIQNAPRQRVNSIRLNPAENGCELKIDSPDTGYGDDRGVFLKRLNKSLAKTQAAKHAEPAKQSGNE
jgi:hypothetical protein